MKNTYILLNLIKINLMKNIILTLLILPFLMLGQSPQGVGYQGVATDLNGVELINQAISIQASVISSSATGNIEWQEEHSVTPTLFTPKIDDFR